MARIGLRVTATSLLLLVTMAGCGSSARSIRGQQRPSSPVGSGASTPAVAEKIVDERQNGGNVDLTTGQRLEVDLHSMYWEVHGASQPDVLSEDTPAQGQPAPAGSCPPGGGCGLIRVVFTAQHAGSALVTASRTTCGEAMRCTGDQGRFRLTVLVRG